MAKKLTKPPKNKRPQVNALSGSHKKRFLGRDAWEKTTQEIVLRSGKKKDTTGRRSTAPLEEGEKRGVGWLKKRFGSK